MAAEFDLLLKGGMVVTGEGLFLHDVAVRGEKIARVGPQIPGDAARETLDVGGKYIFPGIIDVHSHPLYEDDFEATSLTAAWGGTTTLIHYAYAFPGQTVAEALETAISEGSRASYLDFGLHLGLFQVERQYQKIPDAFRFGVRTFKMFMTYAKLGRFTSDYYMTASFDLIAKHGGMAMVHAENA